MCAIAYAYNNDNKTEMRSTTHSHTDIDVTCGLHFAVGERDLSEIPSAGCAGLAMSAVGDARISSHLTTHNCCNHRGVQTLISEV